MAKEKNTFSMRNKSKITDIVVFSFSNKIKHLHEK